MFNTETLLLGSSIFLIEVIPSPSAVFHSDAAADMSEQT